MKSRIKRSCILVALGLIFLFIVLESVLTVSSLIVKKTTPEYEKKQVALKNDPFLILCVGHSYTKGLGAPKGKSYPDFLRRIIHKRIGQKYRVINLGFSGLNSFEIYNRLENYLKYYNPGIVIIRTGDMDHINLNGLYEYLKKTNSNTFKKYIYYVHEKLFFLKTYKFITHLLNKILVSKPLVPKIQIALNKNETCDEKEFAPYVRVGHYIDLDNIPDQNILNNAIACNKLAILKKIDNRSDISVHFYRIGNIYFLLGDLPTALKWYLDGALYYPDISMEESAKGVSSVNFNFRAIKDHYIRSNLSKKEPYKTMIKKFEEELLRLGYNVSYKYLPVQNNVISQWTRSIFNKMINLLKNKNKDVKIIINDYHPIPINNPRAVNNLLKEIARDYSLPMIKNERVWMQLKNVKDYYWNVSGGIDDHPNAKGYELMADTIFDTLVKLNYLKKD